MKKSVLSFLIILSLLVCFSIPAMTAEKHFTDVATDAWYADAVEYCRQNNLMSGTGANTFSPDIPMSRAMLSAVLYRMAESPELAGVNGFSDVVSGTWYTNAVIWAAQTGMMSGYGSGLFGTNDPVTREQVATILWNDSGTPAVSDAAPAFSDAGAISAYAVSAVHWARSSGIMNGKPGNLFDPKGKATRAEVAAILQNYLSIKKPKESGATPIPAANTMYLHIGKEVLTVTLSGNTSTEALKELLGAGDITIDLQDYGGFEKIGGLATRLPENNVQTTTESGDLILYQGNSFVIFYASNSWSYTRLGKINDITQNELKDILGSGNVTVTLSLTP